jgi:hypothetical protein
LVKCRKRSKREQLVHEPHYVTETSLLVLAFHQCAEKYISPDFSQFCTVVTVVCFTNRIAWFLDLWKVWLSKSKAQILWNWICFPLWMIRWQYTLSWVPQKQVYSVVQWFTGAVFVRCNSEDAPPLFHWRMEADPFL